MEAKVLSEVEVDALDGGKCDRISLKFDFVGVLLIYLEDNYLET
ncbi:hypothetical protein [Phormidium nigroviride]